MRKFLKGILLMILALMIMYTAVNLSDLNDQPSQVEDNEIKVNIKLNLNNDIGLFLIDYEVNGEVGTGGISNADKSMIKKDSTDLYWSFDKEQLVKPAETADVKLLFTVVTKYFEPNFDNIYPEEYMIPIDAISFKADFGKTYHVTITEEILEGYQVVVEKP